MKTKVAIILGTRPEAIKLIPIYLELKINDYFEPVLISTGQHASMLKQIFDFFEVKPDIDLQVMQENQTLSSLTSILFDSIGKVFEENKFDFVLVQGDTTTAFVGAVSSLYHKFTLAHVEAGLRTYDKWAPFPEESNRQMIGAVADIHFTPTQTATECLANENIINNVVQVGNSVIDSLLIAKEKIEKNKIKYENRFSSLIDRDKKIILVTGYRRESFGKGFEEICKALATIAENHPEFQIIYPVHMNPNVQKVVYETLGKYKNIKLIDPLPYDELIYIMSQSWLIMTDSGGIQEEAPTLNIPLIVMRDTTERMEGIEAGCSVLSGTSSDKTLKEFYKVIDSHKLYKKMAASLNPYGQGNTSELIVEYLKSYNLSGTNNQ